MKTKIQEAIALVKQTNDLLNDVASILSAVEKPKKEGGICVHNGQLVDELPSEEQKECEACKLFNKTTIFYEGFKVKYCLLCGTKLEA